MADTTSSTRQLCSTVKEEQITRSTIELQNIQTAYRLNGKNYLKWSQLVRTFLKGKGKLGHLLEIAPDSETAGFEAWEKENSMIMSWLWNFMIPEISDTCKALVSFAFSVLGNELRNVWILDSGATDHMTHISNKFKTYSPCPSNRKIVVADDTTTIVTGIGDVQVTPKLVLKNVLHVPQSSTNLISVKKLAKDLADSIIFDESCCDFQDRGSGKRIGLAKEHDGLYYLDTSSQPEFSKSAMSTLSSLFNKDVIWLHHRRLGHVSFSTLKIMFPSLFKGFDVQSLHCDILKFKADGSLERYKARLVAKGYTWTYGVDYRETFAPVAKMNTQYNVKNAFFHEKLEEEIYMSIPSEFSGVDKNKETGMTASKPVGTPIEQNHKLGKAHEDKVVDREMYQRLIGKLIYLAHSKPDIVYSVNVISQFMHDPKEVHLQAVYRVLHYLKVHQVKGILFKKGPEIDLTVYIDADFAGSPVDRRSISRYCTFLGGNLIC
ncbi:uncharacterized protein [Coffea arabica]|uniref:Retrovirus-related Pol polyprotein from transposon RE1 n=1 Tax=Coffea arabica TaxID=13443 RepID=A0ABM4VKB8_COFAR